MNCECGAELGPGAQDPLPGLGIPTKCADCLQRDRIRHVLAMLPQEGERAFEVLPEYEQKFLPSAREYFAAHGSLTPKQSTVLERIYAQRR